jgi:phosphoribosylformimino-5-aminoimidazole carboxamide ribotide isomerase
MIVFPAIDLLSGRVVRLRKGRRDQVDVYSDDPVAQARAFAAQGARGVHVVDLSAAFGEDEAARAANRAAIDGICRVPGISVDVGGGVHDRARVEELLGLGCRRVAMGTALVRDPDFARAAAREFGDALVADVAARGGRVAVDGWREGTDLAVGEFVARLSEMGFRHLVFTDAERDGMRTGIDVAAYERVARAAGFPVVASGGVASLDDVRSLAAEPPGVVEGVICGRALYEGAFTLAQALEAARGGGEGPGSDADDGPAEPAGPGLRSIPAPAPGASDEEVSPC